MHLMLLRFMYFVRNDENKDDQSINQLIFYEKYDWSNHSMIKCTFKKVNNWTTATYALMGAFDYTKAPIGGDGYNRNE